MTTYTTITNALVAVGAKPFATTIQALRDNPLAIAEGDASVPFAYRIGHVLLGTLTTTSGSTQTLSSLDLTAFRFLRLVFNGVSRAAGTTPSLTVGSGTVVLQLGATANNDSVRGFVDIDLFDGINAASLGGLDGGILVSGGATGITTVSTSVSVSVTPRTFDAGSIRIYGVK